MVKVNIKNMVKYILIFLTGCIIGFKVHEYLLIDICLDNGGRWVEQGIYCEGIEILQNKQE